MAGTRNLDSTTGIAAQRAATDRKAASRRLLDQLANLPAVRETAYHITGRELFALSGAWFAHTGWRVRVEFQVELAREGLCEVHGPHVTAYGMAVRRVVLGQQQ